MTRHSLVYFQELCSVLHSLEIREGHLVSSSAHPNGKCAICRERGDCLRESFSIMRRNRQSSHAIDQCIRHWFPERCNTRNLEKCSFKNRTAGRIIVRWKT